MRNSFITLTFAAFGLLVGGCTSGNSAQQPAFTSVNIPTTTKLELAVGTANIGGAGVGLNTVVSFRQPNGLSGTLVNTPTLTGPPGFIVPAVPGAGTDAGTAHISGQTQTPNGSATPPPATFSQRGGAFSYGFAPANADTSGSAFYPQFTAFSSANNGIYSALSGVGAILYTYMEPRYVSDPSLVYPYLGGPPAYPFFQDGTQQPGFLGYPSGFTIFSGATPVAGSYSLSLAIPGNSSSTASTVNTSATLASTALLPLMPTPTFTEDGAGGGTAAITVPPGVTETLVYVVDVPASGNPNFYTIEITGAGAQTAVLPATLGPSHAPSITPPSGTGATATPGDAYFVYAAGFDYPALEAAPPINLSAAPVLTGPSGQADITLSAVAQGAYGLTPASTGHRKLPLGRRR